MFANNLHQLRSWGARLRTLRNLPPIMKLCWKTGPGLITASVSLRLASALIPVAMLWVGKLIIDRIWTGTHSGYRALGHHGFYWVWSSYWLWPAT